MRAKTASVAAQELRTMPLVDHPSFPQPQNPSVPLWRYMDTPKLLWLLLHREIYLRRVDLLPDKFEGTAPKLAREVVQHGIATTGNLPPLKVAQMADQWGKFGRDAYSGDCDRLFRPNVTGDSAGSALWGFITPIGHVPSTAASFWSVSSLLVSRRSRRGV